MNDIKQIDPSTVPFRTLYNGDKIPAIGLGTFGSDHVSNEEVAKAVEIGIETGFRHIDCASVYGNEKNIGKIFAECFKNKVCTREDLWITSKLWNDMHGKGDVIKSCKKSLSDLGLDYLDLYLVHWPFPNFHAKGCSVDSRSPDARPYIHEEFMKTWIEMESLVDAGLVKNIGISNVSVAKLELILKDCRIKPSVCEMECHPNFQQPKLFDYLQENKIVAVGFCPIGSPARPARDTTPNDTVDIQDPVIVKIAKDHNVHPAVICVKWAEQRGQIPIPFSSKARNIYSNLNSVVKDPLTNKEMKEIAGIDKKCRLIKGQVFLWKENQDWADLWDENGVIAK